MKGHRRNPCDDKTVLCLACMNVTKVCYLQQIHIGCDILPQFCKMLPLGSLGKLYMCYRCIIFLQLHVNLQLSQNKRLFNKHFKHAHMQTQMSPSFHQTIVLKPQGCLRIPGMCCFGNWYHFMMQLCTSQKWKGSFDLGSEETLGIHEPGELQNIVSLCFQS